MEPTKLSNKELTDFSKYLSYLLRHGASKVKLPISSDGWAKVSDIFALKGSSKYPYGIEIVKHVVDNNDKKRFALKVENGVYWIRANQGHSDKNVTQVEMKPITSVDELPEGIAIHGTDKAAWDLIKNSGLNKMSRHHIHFAVGRVGSDSVISGMRKTAAVLIYLDVEKALQDGIPLFLSANNVVLSPGVGTTGIIPTKYFKYVLDAKTGKFFDAAFPDEPVSN
eukprot:TRINITY_DN8051_c0_g1_i1.p2 TRINITY_DN8051_c0_g1~~TRINITY_DN8051_c0_g1_i1.p2  ORF type:complete len:224 (-),score=43.62 TRINITY_DN8051_c0_g1_i1:77-748(-)